MRIIGIDPGIGRTGWGIVDKDGMNTTAVAFGCIETEINEQPEQRLASLFTQLQAVIDEHGPETLAIEDLFFQNNVKTAMIVGQARGVILLLASQQQLAVGVYTPLQVKIATTGYGKAAKNQVGQMVKTILKLPAVPKPDDTADALAIAITHAFSLKIPR
jgi:crossover junction endodeoxyribonuclease RuvC